MGIMVDWKVPYMAITLHSLQSHVSTVLFIWHNSLWHALAYVEFEFIQSNNVSTCFVGSRKLGVDSTRKKAHTACGIGKKWHNIFLVNLYTIQYNQSNPIRVAFYNSPLFKE